MKLKLQKSYFSYFKSYFLFLILFLSSFQNLCASTTKNEDSLNTKPKQVFIITSKNLAHEWTKNFIQSIKDFSLKNNTPFSVKVFVIGKELNYAKN